MMAKYVATSLAMEKVVRAPRVISICLPVSTTSMSLVGFESRSTMLPASFAAWVPVFIATATSACASAGASLVPSPVIATRRPCAWCSRISLSLASGVASARKSSTPASAAIAAAVRRLSPVIMMVLMPMRRSSEKRSLSPPLTMSFSSTTPRTRVPSDTTSGVAPRRPTASTFVRPPAGNPAAERLDVLPHRVGRALAQRATFEVHATHAGLRRERHEGAPERGEVALTQVELLLREDHDRAAFGRLVGDRGELGCFGKLLLGNAGRRKERGGLAIAERDRAGLVEEQDVDVAGGFHRAARHSDDVLGDHPAH